MDKPYIKKISEVGRFVVFLVDGKYIRVNKDEEFTNFAHHFDFKFIPENELWIDEPSEEESTYFIDNMLAQINALNKGKSLHEAGIIGNMIEKKERKKSEIILKELKRLNHKDDVLNLIHKKLINKYSKNIKVWLVEGRLVRDLFFLDFVDGGHDKVYNFIPEDEVWIEEDVSLDERKFVILHELHERNLMNEGWFYSLNDKRSILKSSNSKAKVYRSAHEDSSRVEHFCRIHKDKIDEYLERE